MYRDGGLVTPAPPALLCNGTSTAAQAVRTEHPRSISAGSQGNLKTISKFLPALGTTFRTYISLRGLVRVDACRAIHGLNVGGRYRVVVEHLYPHYQEGPDEADLDSDGGLLLLSKHPILQHHQIIYRNGVGADWWANKGAIHIRVKPPDSPTPYDIFFSHTQNMEEDGGKEALYAQLSTMNTMMQEHADPNNPTLIMGDLNIPGEMPEHYSQLIARLGDPVDFWTVAGHTPASGFTYTSDNNFYDDDSDRPDKNMRLDYILMKAGLRFIPILKHIEILKLTHDDKLTHEGRFISDHFGLRAQFEQLVQVEA